MIKTVLALVFALFVSVPAFAEETSFTACTRDGNTATLTLDLYDWAPEAKFDEDKIVNEIIEAFDYVVSSHSDEDIVGHVGFAAFREALSEDAHTAIEGIKGVPEIVKGCGSGNVHELSHP